MAAGTSAGVQQLTLRHDVRHAGADCERRGQRLPGAGAAATNQLTTPL